MKDAANLVLLSTKACGIRTRLINALGHGCPFLLPLSRAAGTAQFEERRGRYLGSPAPSSCFSGVGQQTSNLAELDGTLCCKCAVMSKSKERSSSKADAL